MCRYWRAFLPFGIFRDVIKSYRNKKMNDRNGKTHTYILRKKIEHIIEMNPYKTINKIIPSRGPHESNYTIKMTLYAKNLHFAIFAVFFKQQKLQCVHLYQICHFNRIIWLKWSPQRGLFCVLKSSLFNVQFFSSKRGYVYLLFVL